jgi:S1-C subfamily serine protease
MSSFAKRAALLAGIAFVILASPAKAEKLTKAEIGKVGKAATAYIDVPGRGSGTAFCIHSSGLFVTNEHVIRGKEKGEIKVVLDASLKTQRVFSATVVRIDKVRDLALLRVNTKDALPSLTLGSVEGVAELMDVVAFGFPLGAAMSADRKEYPAMSVNVGNVSALRLKEGELAFIQVDVSVTFGSSGGPVLDENGKVIGVIVSGVPGQRGINLAIPVSHLSRFLEAPDIQFTPPTLMRETLDKPMEFKAKVVSVVPGAKEPSLKLILRAGDKAAREFPMTAKDGAFVATATPVTKLGSGRVEISIRLGTGMISGLVDDLVLKVAGNPIKLSRVKRIELKPKPAVLMADGKTVDGEVTGLGSVELQLGDEKVKLDLAKAIQIQVTPAAEVGVITATVVASANGKEVGRLEVPISVKDSTTFVPADPSSVVTKPPALADDRVVKRLPEPFSAMCLGGEGRYLIFLLPRAHKLAIFDVNEAKVTNYISLAEDKVVFAAGLDKLVIGLPSKGIIERWSLTTFERETSVSFKSSEEVKWINMGHASNGPVVVNSGFLDLATLKPLPITLTQGRGFDRGGPLHTAANGTAFSKWGDPVVTFVPEGGEFKRHDGNFGGHALLGPDGTRLYTMIGVFTAALTRSFPETAMARGDYFYCVPAVSGNYFLSLTSADNGKGGGLTVYLQGHPQPLARLDRIEHGLKFGNIGRSDTEAWRRIYLVPQANAIIVLPMSNDEIVLHKFDVGAALEKSGLDYLEVTSTPVRSIKAGDTLDYKIAVKAKHAPVSFKLDLGPKGMDVSKDGQLTWKVPTDAIDSEQAVILTVRDAKGQEIFHTFAIRVVK